MNVSNNGLELIMLVSIVAVWFLAKRIYTMLGDYFWALTILPITVNVILLIISISTIMPRITLQIYFIVLFLWTLVLPSVHLRGSITGGLSDYITKKKHTPNFRQDYVFWCIVSIPLHLWFILMGT